MKFGKIAKSINKFGKKATADASSFGKKALHQADIGERTGSL